MALSTVFIYSCNKDNLVQKEVVETPLESIHGLSREFIKEQNMMPNSKAGGFWARVIGADLTGAGAGFIAGAGVLAGGVGALPGGIIGGVLAGGGASFTVGGNLIADRNQNGVPPTNNSDNPYDYIGISHYEIMSIIEDNTEDYFQNGEITMSKYEPLVFNTLSKNYKDYSYSMTDFSEEKYLEIINTYANWNKSTDEFFVRDNDVLKNVPTNIISILSEYSKALENTVSSIDFTIFSVNAEKIIVNSEILEEHKAFILSYMSTARIGIEYYY